ncbi:GNAT family N-acetyltransferase [Paenibacillus sp. BSR1-1]|uniref:GNAT family N-acetyltransferase n=1 Tax=Paenibacillus sp. BSR1-1 TaxID=3020845 RepID=UPI0025B11B88|nr:GNAT family N-acetyltransferase [Paenibacillus sp. BSR1-1]MDN3015549.1 GNAT family N-acetyltransferase [Paenibacillus sp. BSR1-1]
MLFKSDGLKVRKLEEKDKYLLAKWLSDPSVLEFYEGRNNPFNIYRVNAKFYNRRDGVTGCIVEYEGIEIGYIQYYQLDDEVKKEYGYTDGKIFGTDQFIGEGEFRNKGIGTLIVTSMVKFLINYYKADRVVMDPQTRNTRDIKCYEKCGFKKVKILPNHELHEGEYQDCWMIEYHK